MLIKIPELKVPEENPFEFDVLNRKENAEILTQLISTLNEPFVLSIDSKWGSGKTTFIRMWKQYLENNDYKVVYFNAWENDISDDALSALVAELKKAIKTSAKSETNQIFENIKNATTKLLKRSIPVVVKLGTQGLIDASPLLENSISTLTEKLAIDSIESYEKRQEDIKRFKEELEKFAKCLNDESNKPMIFFIDELDRCRPNFAIEILEKAKHLFSVKNIMFIISIDKKELGNSIKAIYGNNLDTDGYLRRFIDLNYLLPNPDIGTYCHFMIEKFHLNSFFDKRLSYNELRYDYENFLRAINLFNSVNFSLRTIEQCFSQISIVLRTIPENGFMYPELLVFLIVLKNHNPDLYQKLKLKQCNESEVITYLYSIDETEKIIESDFGMILEALIAYTVSNYLHEINNNFIKTRYSDRLNEESLAEDIKLRYRYIIEIINLESYKIGRNFLKTLLDKIEISQRFI